jgi:hypothetical protein
MTKLTSLDLYILTDTVLHSISHGEYWTGSSTEEARTNIVKKLQMIMNEMEVEVSMGKTDDFT